MFLWDKKLFYNLAVTAPVIILKNIEPDRREVNREQHNCSFLCKNDEHVH